MSSAVATKSQPGKFYLLGDNLVDRETYIVELAKVMAILEYAVTAVVGMEDQITLDIANQISYKEVVCMISAFTVESIEEDLVPILKDCVNSDWTKSTLFDMVTRYVANLTLTVSTRLIVYPVSTTIH